MDRSVRPDIVWVTALRALDEQHRTTSLLRLGCLAVLWAAAATLPADELARAGGQLALVTVGCLLSGVHARPALTDALERLPGAGGLTGHLAGTRGRAIVDVPGLLEAFGVVAAGLLFAGPWPVAGLSVSARSVGVLASVAFAWLVGLNALLDAGWYAPYAPVIIGSDRSDQPAPRVLRVLRRLMPSLLAILVVLIVAVPWVPEVAAVPVVLRAAAVGAMFVLEIVWICFEQLLAATVATVRDAEDIVRKGAAQDLHSLTKNAVRLVATTVEGPDPNLAQIRVLVRDLLVVVEENRLEMLTEGGAARAHDVAALWQVIVRILPDSGRHRCHLVAGHDIALRGTDYQLARRVVADLVMNALKAGATRVEVGVALDLDTDDRFHRFTLDVTDDGPGMPADAGEDPAGSLRLLDWELNRYGGGITFDPRPERGTEVHVRWRSPRAVRRRAGEGL
ncbi:ATP-binding protein [Frankia tisae]|uniref:ATP-binding protein n=1 Tax=Frankia tisae TaxID=2950104 RepID=UPI0021BF228D|nr:ATP-binding protein [Frankia tisae]